MLFRSRGNIYSCIVVPNHKYHILGCSNLNYLNESLTCFCGNYLSSRCIASRNDSDMQLFMFDTFRCVEHMYNRHTKKEEHMNVSAIHLMCRFMTLCVADPIRGVCCYSYTLFWHGTLWCQHAPELAETLQVRLRGSRSEPSVQVPSIPKQEPLHEIQIQRSAGPDTES